MVAVPQLGIAPEVGIAFGRAVHSNGRFGLDAGDQGFAFSLPQSEHLLQEDGAFGIGEIRQGGSRRRLGDPIIEPRIPQPGGEVTQLLLGIRDGTVVRHGLRSEAAERVVLEFSQESSRAVPCRGSMELETPCDEFTDERMAEPLEVDVHVEPAGEFVV